MNKKNIVEEVADTTSDTDDDAEEPITIEYLNKEFDQNHQKLEEE